MNNSTYITDSKRNRDLFWVEPEDMTQDELREIQHQCRQFIEGIEKYVNVHLEKQLKAESLLRPIEDTRQRLELEKARSQERLKQLWELSEQTLRRIKVIDDKLSQ